VYLLIVDTTQIQPFIFGGNRLRENVGASHLVASVTGEWSLQEVGNVTPRHNVADAAENKLDDTPCVESGAIAAEVIYAGGGNVAILFSDKLDAERFERVLSRRVLEYAPNLQTVIACREIDWEQESLIETFDQVFERLNIEKRSRTLSAPLHGLGVTVSCQATGLPAIGMSRVINDDPTSQYPASAEALAKLGTVSDANERLRRMCKGALKDGFAFPLDMDKLGRTHGEQSQIAVVHSDGDGVGACIKKIGKKLTEKFQQANISSYSQLNREYVKQLREFSRAVDSSGREALRKVIAKLIDSVDTRDGIIRHPSGKARVAPINLDLDKDDKYRLPMRPIVFGGDDVTFVCDARIGIPLALEYMNQFAAETKEKLGEAITSCAGIAIVKTHYPFSRAYALAEDLCQSAKKYRREHKDELKDVACLDWHIAFTGLAGDVEEIRRREYTSKTNLRMTQRPVALKQISVTDALAWEVVESALKAFQDEEWSDKRNKVKALRDALREGENAVDKFLKMYGLTKERLPQLDSGDQLEEFRRKGWSGDVCGYFDAVELLDLYLPLEGQGALVGGEQYGDGDTAATQE